MPSSYNNPNHVLKPELGSGQIQGDHFTFSSIPYNPSPGPPGLIDRRPLPNIDAQSATPTPVASQIQTAAQRRENAKARRRVPTSQRKRTKLSCDACKAKRCKCLRTGPSPDSDDAQDAGSLASCKNCLDAGIECVTTLPRKQRIYGSVEQLDRRYRALDALVSGLFADLPPDATADELVEFGRQRGLAMPELGPDSEASKSPAGTMATLVSPITPETAEQRIGDDDRDSDPNNALFLKDTSGRSYYIGPAGSLASFARIRDLIARRLNASADPDASRRGQHLSSKSVTDTIAGSFDETSVHVMPPAPSAPAEAIDMSLGKIERGRSDTITTSDSASLVPVSKIKLPTKGLADACVNAFFDRVHPDFMLIHRPVFQQHYEEIWKSSSRRPSVPFLSAQKETHVSVGWLCCLYLIFILGSRAQPQTPKSLDFQRTWYDSVNELASLLTASTLPNVCALMLLALYFQGTNDRRKSWFYLGTACRLAIALGMHRDCANEGMSPLVQEIRKRVWWTLYDYEQHLCCSLGRPSAIDDIEVNVGAPDEQMLQCVPSFSKQHIDCWVRLIRLQAAIRREVHAPSSTAASVVPQAVQLLRRLGAWRRELPQELLPTAPDQARRDPRRWRRIISLHIQYQKIINLLTRRFLLKEVESIDQDEGLGEEAFIIVKLGKVCVTSAMRCVRLLVDLWRVGQFNGVTSLDTYYAYLCSTQICLRLLEPSRPVPLEQAGDGRADGWKFHPLEPRVGSGASQPRSEVDSEVDTLIAQGDLIENHSAAQLTEAIREIHDLLKTVPMSGFSAKCEMISSEFAKAVGAVDGKPMSSLFGGNMGQDMNKVADNMNGVRDSSLNMSLASAPLFNGTGAPSGISSIDQQPQGFQQNPASLEPTMSLAMTTAMTSNVMDYIYSGVLDANSVGGVQALQQPQIQWDMVQPPEEWSERNGMITDLAANSWNWPFQGEFPYNSMNPPQ
ncbi:putative Fungal-specific transcription factor domain-containing protein [Seiridium cardinale]